MKEEAIHDAKPAMAPCREACPAGIDVPRYLRRIREGRFEEALAVIRERIPFPFVCGHACVHPCESRCARNQFDDAIAIRMLKRVAAERGDQNAAAMARRTATGKRIAVIGAGPCGLTAAHYLNLLGHRVTVFEAHPQAGGMLRYALPGYRLPAAVVEREIGLIREGGVEIVTGTPVSSAEALREKGYDAVLAATGAWKPVRLGIPGEESANVIDGLSFLIQVNGRKAPAVGRSVVVVGGGNTAVDAARAALRLGAEVTQLYRRTFSEMPANSEEVIDAVAEGVRIDYLAAPVAVGKEGLTCVRMRLGEADAGGRPAPVPIAGSDYRLDCDTLIVAVGQSADAASLHLQGQKGGTFSVDPGSLATAKRGIFAAGDAVRGPATIIEAIAHGRQASVSIDRFLGGTGVIPEALSEEGATEAPETAPRGSGRPKTQKISLAKRRTTFAPVERAYSAKAAVSEAGRCLGCDLRAFEVVVDHQVCKDCGYCREVCDYEIFRQSDDFNPSGYRPAVAADTDRCVGCLRCLYICPDFAITIRETGLR